MKALAIDSASSCITIAGRNEEKTAVLSLDIGMRQSEKILPLLIQTLSEIDLKPSDLEFTSLCLGPGSFTGLRLAFATLKSLQVAHGIPIYGINTLSVLAHPYKTWKGAIVPVIDAKKHRFYVSIFRAGTQCLATCDIDSKQVTEHLDEEENILCVGPDAQLFIDEIKNYKPEISIDYYPVHSSNNAITLLNMAYTMHCNNEKPLEDYEGPLYIRKSEAEESLLPKKIR